MTLRYHPEAERELEEATEWYDAQRLTLGNRFVAAIKSAVAYIEQFPRGSARVRVAGSKREVRRRVVQGFPYVIWYQIDGDDLLLLAISHTSRDPLYWKDRLT